MTGPDMPGFDVIEIEVNGARGLLVTAAVPDGASPEVREGMVRRRLTMLTGRCPCGAELVMPSRRERRAAKRAGRRVTDAFVWHKPGCPASLDGWR